jgi:hypothetical protein
MSKSIGIDLGSQKTMIVKDDADIVLTDTGKFIDAQFDFKSLKGSF